MIRYCDLRSALLSFLCCLRCLSFFLLSLFLFFSLLGKLCSSFSLPVFLLVVFRSFSLFWLVFDVVSHARLLGDDGLVRWRDIFCLPLHDLLHLHFDPLYFALLLGHCIPLCLFLGFFFRLDLVDLFLLIEKFYCILDLVRYSPYALFLSLVGVEHVSLISCYAEPVCPWNGRLDFWLLLGRSSGQCR